MRPHIIAIASLVAAAEGCAHQSSATEPPELSRGPCDKLKDPGLLEQLFPDPADQFQLQRQCEAERAREQQDQIVAQLAEQQKVEAEHERKAEEEAEKHRAELAASNAAKAAESERQAKLADQARYDAAIEAGASDECAASWDELRGHYALLKAYVASEQRDRAIDSFERCRKEYAATIRKITPGVISESRKEFALGIEDAFDDANPWTRGKLVAKPEGSVLTVRLRGNFEGRARHSQTQVEEWCGLEATEIFSKIVLQNSHGTFSCRPVRWRGSTRAFADEYLEQQGALEPLSKEPGTRILLDLEGRPPVPPSPSAPPPPPPPPPLPSRPG